MSRPKRAAPLVFLRFFLDWKANASLARNRDGTGYGVVMSGRALFCGYAHGDKT
jgi:hypothetical protein